MAQPSPTREVQRTASQAARVTFPLIKAPRKLLDARDAAHSPRRFSGAPITGFGVLA